MMVPNSPGGGYDLTARTAVKIMEDNDITGRVEVFNVIGAGGTVAMARLMNERGNDDLMMTMGLGVVGATYTNGSNIKASDATAIAKLIEDPGAVFVPADSPFKTVQDFVAAWKADPSKVTIGGGSSPGGPDHLFPMELAKAVGVDPKTRQLHHLRRRRRPADRAARQEDHRGHVEPGRAHRPDRGRPAAGARGVQRGARRGHRRPDAEGSWDRPDVRQLARSPCATGYFGRRQASDGQGARGDAWHAAVEGGIGEERWTDAFVTGAEFEQFLKDQDNRVSSTLTELGLL